MNDYVNFETYLLISPDKFSIRVFRKSDFEILYRNEKLLNNQTNEIDYSLLNTFLNDTIFKVEKEINNFIKSVNLIVGFDVFFNLKISVKKNFYGNSINNKDLNYLLQDTKKQCQKTLEGYKISHMIIDNYMIDEKNFSYFPENTNCNNLIVDVTFISIPVMLVNNFEKILKNFHISTNHILNVSYLNEFFKDKEKDIFKMAKNITEGCNPNEISLIQKPLKNKGFFEKFFHFFN